MAKALALANMSKILRDMANGRGNGIGNGKIRWRDEHGSIIVCHWRMQRLNS